MIDIDLGEYDSETGTITIPDFGDIGTVKNRRSKHVGKGFFDSDDESESSQTPNLTARKGTFKFPMAPPEPKQPKRSPRKSPSPATTPFVFPAPVSSRPPTPGEPRRNLVRAATVVVSSPHGAEMQSESASAPSSPPRSNFDADDTLRPSTSASETYFEPGNRASFHKQSRSGPPNISATKQPSPTLLSPGTAGEQPLAKVNSRDGLATAPISRPDHSRSSTRSHSDGRSNSSDGAGSTRSPRKRYPRVIPASATATTFAGRYRQHIPQISSDFSTTSETDEERVVQQVHSDDDDGDYDDDRALFLPIPMPPIAAAMEPDAPLEIYEAELARLLNDFVDTIEVFRVGMDRADRKAMGDDDSTPVAMAKNSPLLGSNGQGK